MPLTISVSPGAHISRPITLQKLPRELQLLIYGFAVVEPLRWERRHQLTCEWKPINTRDLEPPPFTLAEIDIKGPCTKRPQRVVLSKQCPCGKREGLGLLLTCRSINEMASPIFWSENTFCFFEPVEFNAIMKRNIRPQWRDMIRSFSIINADLAGDLQYFDGSYKKKNNDRNLFWNLLKDCRSLDRLEISPAYIEPDKNTPIDVHFRELAEMVPNLSMLRLTWLIPISSLVQNWWGYPHPWYARCYHETFYVQCTRRIPLVPPEEPWTFPGLKVLHHNMQYNFRTYVDTAVKVDFLNADIENLEQYKKTWHLAPNLNENSNIRRITLPTGETTIIKIYGLPITTKTRIARMRYIRAEERKKELENDGSRAAECDALKAAKERRKQNRESELTKESEKYRDAILARDVRRLELDAIETASAKKAIKKENQKRRSAIKTTNEIRQSERKRVGKS